MGPIFPPILNQYLKTAISIGNEYLDKDFDQNIYIDCVHVEIMVVIDQNWWMKAKLLHMFTKQCVKCVTMCKTLPEAQRTHGLRP